ncbi:MAG: BMP family ABC transporter substrate-binding protein [Gaiellales bacterium]
MAIRKWMIVGALTLVGVVALVGSSVGSAKPKADYRVALVTDIGGLNDKGFNALAYKGLKQAMKAGVEGRVFISKTQQDYIPNLSAGAKGGYDLVIAVGFLMSDSTAAVAKKYPDTKFAIVDVSAPFMKGKPKNARGITFAEQEAGCLAGVAAATVTKSNTIASVGGLKIPPVDAFIAGYQFCAKKVKPSIETLNDYSQDFVDQAKCKELALKQNDGGADVLFQVAGGCGLGVLAAAKERKVWGIGVDNDQGFLGGHVLTSAVKRVDAGVFQTIQLAKSGKFKGGVDGVFNVKNGGVGAGKLSAKTPNKAAVQGKLNLWAKKLASGAVKPPREVK